MSTIEARRVANEASVIDRRGVGVGSRSLRIGVLIGLGLSIAWQAALAGQFLSGQTWALDLHADGALAVVLLGIAAFAVEIRVGRRFGRGAAWVAAVLLVAILTQYVLGYLTGTGSSRLIAYHVPLGVAIAGLYVYYATVAIRRTKEGI